MQDAAPKTPLCVQEDYAHLSGVTGHRVLAELAMHLLDSVARRLKRKPITAQEHEIARAPLKLPMADGGRPGAVHRVGTFLIFYLHQPVKIFFLSAKHRERAHPQTDDHGGLGGLPAWAQRQPARCSGPPQQTLAHTCDHPTAQPHNRPTAQPQATTRA